MIRINLSMDNGATSKYLTARGGVCIPSPGNAGLTCPLQLVPWTQTSFASQLPAGLVFGELSTSPTTPRPHHCCVTEGETLRVLWSHRHPNPISLEG